MIAARELEALEAEVCDLERSSDAAKQRVLQHREGVEATAREIGIAEEALAQVADRFPWHLDTLRMIRERLETLQQQRDERGRALRGAEEHHRRWEARLRDGRARLDQLRGDELEREQGFDVIAQPPRHTLPYGLPSVGLPSVGLPVNLPSAARTDSAHPPRPPAPGRDLPRMRFDPTAAIEAIDAGDGLRLTADSQLMLAVVQQLRTTVERLEHDNAQLRRRLGSVENNHLYLIKRLREQEGDLQQLRDGQRRLETLPHPSTAGAGSSGGDLWDRLGDQEHDDLLFSEWDEELTPTVEPPNRTLRAVRKKAVVSALDTSKRDKDPELVFDEEFDRDVSALIRLMGKYQVERLDPHSGDRTNHHSTSLPSVAKAN